MCFYLARVKMFAHMTLKVSKPIFTSNTPAWIWSATNQEFFYLCKKKKSSKNNFIAWSYIVYCTVVYSLTRMCLQNWRLFCLLQSAWYISSENRFEIITVSSSWFFWRNYYQAYSLSFQIRVQWLSPGHMLTSFLEHVNI